MSSPSRVGTTLTLDEFLRMPEIDERPYKEFVGGRVEEKPYLGARASTLMGRLIRSLSRFAEPMGLGEPFLSLRCTFAGRSVIAALAFLEDAKIEADGEGIIIDETLVLPDLYVEFLEPRGRVG